MKSFKSYRPVIFVFVLVLFGVGVFFFISNRPKADPGGTTTSELSKIVDKNYDKNYPPTPREVAAAYSDVSLYLHNKDYTDAEFDKLITVARKLMDDELLAQNPLATHKTALQKEIQSFKKDNVEIVSYTLPELSEVTYFTFEGAECAGVKVSFFIKKSEGTFTKTFEQYLFRKDSSGKWKLYGYKQVKS